MREFWVPVATIAWKDLLLELRTKEIVTSVLVFALVAVVVFYFALRPTPQTIGFVAPGVLWVAFTFAGSLVMMRTFVLEKEQGSLEGLMLCPVSRDVLYFGKLISGFLFMLVVEAAILPVFSVLFDAPLLNPALFGVLVLTTLGFASVGTLFSAISVNTRSREIMLPILFFPMVVPVLIAAVAATAIVLDGASQERLGQWLAFSGAFAAIFVTLSALLFGYTLEE
ncbi:MAG: heme ABC transporter permease CcmB [Dehalococcoidia bacterium]|nr:heme ABC transporter permease CcmB [Dehalococcoidia bacterium]